MQRVHLEGEEGRCGVGDEANEHLKHLNTAGWLALIRCFTYVSVAPRNVKFNPPKLHYRATPAPLQRLPHVWVSGSSSCFLSSVSTAEEWC